MRPIKSDQAQVDLTLRVGVGAQNDRKFEFYAVTRTLTWLYTYYPHYLLK